MKELPRFHSIHVICKEILKDVKVIIQIIKKAFQDLNFVHSLIYF